MDGVLGRFGKRIQGVLGNPNVQGMALMAATGFNPLLGLLAGPAIANHREKSKLQNEAARLELSGERDRQNNSRRQRAAMQQLAGMMGGTNVLQGPSQSMTLDSVSGPGSVLEIPGKKSVEPDAERRLMGLLADASPEAFGQVLGQRLTPPKAPTISRDLADYRAALASGDKELAAALRKRMMEGEGADPKELLEIEALKLNIAESLENMRRQTETGQIEKSEAADNISNNLSSVKRILDLNEELEDSPLPPGVAGNEMMRGIGSVAGAIGDRIGWDWLGQFNDPISAHDQLKKESATQLDRLARDGGINSAAERASLAERLPGTSVSPGANVNAAMSLLQEQLQEARRLNLNIPGLDTYEKMYEDYINQRGRFAPKTPDGVPAGSKLIGTKDGKLVYEDPDGNWHVEN